MLGILIAVAVLLLLLFQWVHVLAEYERGVVFRFGRVLTSTMARSK